MLIHHLKVCGLLSFGPTGIDLPLESLNVFIGPNGSGKSNLLEVLALLRAAPRNLPIPIKEMGGVVEWLWKGPESPRRATVDLVLDPPQGNMPVRHVLEVTENGQRFEVADERIENARSYGSQEDVYFFYRFRGGHPIINDLAQRSRGLRRENVKPEESILSQVRDPESFPVLHWLQEQYERIRLYRDWTFGPSAPIRQEQSAHKSSDFLNSNGDNLALVLSKIRPRIRNEFIQSLKHLFDGIVDIHLTVDGGNVLLFLEESDYREIPVTRLSDGTLRYLSLLAILLHPEPPPLVAIEEPELGLHPDLIPEIARLLVQASKRMQIMVTTHSRMLIDALSDYPSSVVVCTKEKGQSRFERLDGERLKNWLDCYSLGSLWSMGEIGGNRW